MKKLSKGKYLSKVRGALFGSYIGDTMGATTEFMSKEFIELTYGKLEDIVGGGWLDIKPGESTDDTQMSLLIMETLMGLNDREDFKTKLADAFVYWYDTKPKDIGCQTARAIAYYKATGNFLSYEASALGNGSLMRNLPTALLGKALFCTKQSTITHNNSVVSEIVIDHCTRVQALLNGERVYKSRVGELLEPTGFIVNTWTNANYWAAQSSFEECIVGAVNDGGDADTIACIAGGLSGLVFGFESIPERWLSKLDPVICEKLDTFANWLVEVKYNA